MSTTDQNIYPGLDQTSRKEWPGVISQKERPVDSLKPNSREHQYVLDYLMKRLKGAEDAMQQFYSRWQSNELRTQAYISLPDYDNILKQMNDAGEPPNPVSITVPYIFATLNTVVTYLIHTFAGRKPMFQVGSYKREHAEAARMMEVLLQFNADHERLIRNLFQFFNDGVLYGVGALRTQWKNDVQARTVWRPKPRGMLSSIMGLFGGGGEEELEAVREERTVFQGTSVESIDPFNFFPDPRVQMSRVSTDGEFVFWRTFEGRHQLKRAQADGILMWVDDIPDAPPPTGLESRRNYRAGGTPVPGRPWSGRSKGELRDFVQIDQGTVEIIPRELGLSESDELEKWIFTIANETHILQAEPFDADHGRHPIVVIEPYSLGYGFGQLGIADFLAPIQDTMSWLVNSHIHNVRAALNNMFVVDPSMIELQDFANPKPGKAIRLKSAAYGRDVRTVLQQFQVTDVTTAHIRDMQDILRLGDSLSSVNDNLRGVQQQGGRKTATEVRTSGEAGASRLASLAKLISSQGVVDLAEQMALNFQQRLTEDFYIQVVGMQGYETPLHVTPEQIVGDFHFPVNDGTLPLDRVALLEVWKELFMGMMSDPELRQQYQIPKVFEWIAELSGAQNISSFRINVQPDAMVQQQAQTGDMVPMQEAINALGTAPTGVPGGMSVI